MKDDGRYLWAGFGYWLLGLSVIAVTVWSPGFLTGERRADLAHLLIAIPFLLLFGAFIAWGHRPIAGLAGLLGSAPGRAQQVGRWWREKVVQILAVTSFGRLLVFVLNGAGWRPRLAEGFRLEEVPAQPRMFLAAAFMAVLVTLLLRASWIPFLRRGKS